METNASSGGLPDRKLTTGKSLVRFPTNHNKGGDDAAARQTSGSHKKFEPSWNCRLKAKSLFGRRKEKLERRKHEQMLPYDVMKTGELGRAGGTV